MKPFLRRWEAFPLFDRYSGSGQKFKVTLEFEAVVSAEDLWLFIERFNSQFENKDTDPLDDFRLEGPK